MIVTIFGATGTVGKYLVRKARARGYHVRAFGRNVVNITDDAIRSGNFTAIKGYLMDYAEVADAINGADCVLSAIGGDIEGSDKSRSLGMKNIVKAMLEKGVQRIVAIGNLGILPRVPEGPELIMDQPDFPPEYKNVSREHLLAYELLAESGLEWTMACPPNIIDKEADGNYTVTAEDDGPMPFVYAGNLADFMVDELTQKNFLKQRVGISNNLDD